MVEVFVHVNSSDLYKTGHMANRWFRGLALKLEREVKAAAPVRSGDLVRGIDADVTAVPSTQHMTLDLTMSSGHTLAVLRGTKDAEVGPNGWWGQPISSDTPGKMMHVAPGPMHDVSPQFRVAGQDPQNFLLKGWKRTAATHKAMARTPYFVTNP